MNIYVANLAPQVTEEMLQRLFSIYGTVESVRLMIDLQTKVSKGYAFVAMSDVEEAEGAIEMLNGSFLENKKIAVRKASKEKGTETSFPPTPKPTLKPAKKPVPKPDLSIFDALPFEGTIKFFDDTKGFGFIILSNQRELFFHLSALPEDDERARQSGTPVTFFIQAGKKGFVATNIVCKERCEETLL